MQIKERLDHRVEAVFIYPVYSAHCFSLSVGTTKQKQKQQNNNKKRDFIESLLHLNYIAIESIQLNTQSNGLEKKNFRSQNRKCVEYVEI